MVYRNQKARADTYLELLNSLLQPAPSTSGLIAFGQHFVGSTTVTMVVGRGVLGSLVDALCGGTSLKRNSNNGDPEEDDGKWTDIGRQAFSGSDGTELRGNVVDGILGSENMAGWCEEQVS